jgi:hypothetical protein
MAVPLFLATVLRVPAATLRGSVSSSLRMALRELLGGDLRGVALPRITVTTNLPDVRRSLGKLQQEVATIPARALNRVADLARVEMRRQITAEFNLAAAEVRRLVLTRRAKSTAGDRVEAMVFVQPRRGQARSLNLARFIVGRKAVSSQQVRRQLKAGALKPLQVKVKKRGGAKPVQGAFVANAGRTVFRRAGDARLPIKPVQTVDVGQMFNTRSINERVREFIDARLPTEVDRLTKLAVSRLR